MFVFFLCLFAWNIFFHPFTFSLCRSFVLWWLCCRQHICGSCFLIHSATLCLLIGAFNPFALIYWLVLTRCHFFLLCSSLSLFLHLLKAGPLASLAVLGWWVCILLALFLLWNSLFHLPFKMRALPGRVVLVSGLCFSLLGIILAIPFWHIVFLLRNQVVALSGSLVCY